MLLLRKRFDKKILIWMNLECIALITVVPESVFLESLFDYDPFHEGNTHTGHSHCNALDALFEH